MTVSWQFLTLMCYLKDDVAISLIELAVESFIHLDGNKVFYLIYWYTWNLQEGEIQKIHLYKWSSKKKIFNTCALYLFLVLAEKGQSARTNKHTRTHITCPTSSIKYSE